MYKFLLTCSILLLGIITGCTLADVKVNVAGQRTSLENQVLGSYNSLTEKTLLVASVRGVTPTGQIETKAEQSLEQSLAVEAMQVIGFHQDDIRNFKTLGWIGENTKGLLTTFPRQTKDIPSELQDFAARYPKAEFTSVVKEVNQARQTIMEQVIRTNEQFTEKDLDRIRRVFWKMHLEQTLSDEKIQTEEGKWIIKE